MKTQNKIRYFLVFIFLLFSAHSAFAVPSLQVYIDGATAGDKGADLDTWFATSSSFDLKVVGGYKTGGNGTLSITNAKLILSVLEDDSGSVGITPDGGGSPLVASGEFATKQDIPIPDFNNHWPFQNAVSDFIVFNIDDFSNLGPVNNYDAGSGSISLNDGVGEEKVFNVSVSGYRYVHFDVIAEVTDKNGTNWEINPGSHDSSYHEENFNDFDVVIVPAPGALLLASMGLGIVSWARRRKTI